MWRLAFVSFSSVEQGQIQEIKNVPEENWTFDGKYEREPLKTQKVKAWNGFPE